MPWGVLGIKNVYDKEEVLNVHPVVVGGGTNGYAFHVLSLKFSSLCMLLKS